MVKILDPKHLAIGSISDLNGFGWWWRMNQYWFDPVDNTSLIIRRIQIVVVRWIYYRDNSVPHVVSRWTIVPWRVVVVVVVVAPEWPLSSSSSSVWQCCDGTVVVSSTIVILECTTTTTFLYKGIRISHVHRRTVSTDRY